MCRTRDFSVSGSNISVQQNIAEPVKPLSKGDSDGLVVEEAKGSAKSSDDCKAPGNVASKDATTGSTLQSNGTGVDVVAYAIF